ncbi:MULTISPECIES: hypothetical protein [unclassified Nocardia]|uniref:hypothetical protein n=1 Tax=unclassified Nocardia TaxID=2637762 RepID=UPI001CE45864|nr:MULTISPECIES: hypothetical protein [unclassified Nocardia]
MPIPTTPVSSRKPAIAALVAVPVFAVATGVLMLTTDRTPRPVAHFTSIHAGGCVMFCDPAPGPVPSYAGVDCVANCPPVTPTPTPAPPKPGQCLMFCTEPGWKGDR